MKMEIAAGAALVSLIAGGCNGESTNEINKPSHTPVTPSEMAKPEEELTISKKVTATKTIRVGTLPDKLPQAVAKNINSTVEIRGSRKIVVQTNQGKDSLYNWDVVKASGVKIAPGLILTAGHILIYKDGKPAENYTCGDLDVFTHTWGPGKVTKAVTLYEGDSFKPDAALLRIQSETQTPQATIRSSPLKPGEHVYFSNYQENEKNGNDRTLTLWDEPVIFGGVVYGSDVLGELVITNLQSYGTHTDTNSSNGGSGGAIFDTHGKLVGITHAEIKYPVSASNFKPIFGTKITGVPDNKILNIDSIQPITPKFVNKLNDELDQAPLCKNSIPKMWSPVE